MSSKISIKNNIDSELTIQHSDNEGAITVTSTDLAKLTEINLKNLADGTLPTADPHVIGQLWNNAGIVTVSAG